MASESWSAVTADGPVPAGGEHAGVFPLDEHNVKLLDNVHPRAWVNPTVPDDFVYDLIAVGAGAGGLVSAKQSARRGARSALIEQHLAGGDCLNVGCVPSKALLRCARSIAERRRDDMGMEGGCEKIEFAGVMQRMRRLRAQIAPVDSHEATKKAGSDMFVGRATFIGPHEIQVAGQSLRFRKAVIATGARAGVPPIPGLDSIPYLTNATLFNLTELPPRLVVLGAGPIGLEMAQSFRRFGSDVTVIEVFERIMGPEDEDAATVLHEVLQKEGIHLLTGMKVEEVTHTEGKPWPEIRVTVSKNDARQEVVCDAFLVAAGRVPNVEDLGLDVAEVQYKPRLGVHVNDDLSTSNPDIFAVGDVIDRPEFRFTHMAGTMAGIAVQNALFQGQGLPVNAAANTISQLVVPRVTYTEPEVASCGVSNKRLADLKGLDVDVYQASVEHNDRSILEGDFPHGFVKILCRKHTDEIVGATLVAERAGDMLAELTLAVQHKIGLSAIARTIHPYPTVGEAVQQCALNFNRQRWAKMNGADGLNGQ